MYKAHNTGVFYTNSPNPKFFRSQIKLRRQESNHFTSMTSMWKLLSMESYILL